jgi:hypothetical protein
MNKKILSLAIIFILLGAGYIFYQNREENTLIVPSTNSTSTSKAVSECDTFETLSINPKLIKAFGNKTPITFTNSLGITITLKDTLEEARNPGSNVYINQNKIGSVEGQGVVDGAFSQDNKKFLFSVYTVAGAACIHKYSYEIDISASSLKIEK